MLHIHVMTRSEVAAYKRSLFLARREANALARANGTYIHGFIGWDAWDEHVKAVGEAKAKTPEAATAVSDGRASG